MDYPSFSQIDTLSFALFEDFQIGVSDSSLDILTNSECKFNISVSKSKKQKHIF